jgi:hypothetical protein
VKPDPTRVLDVTAAHLMMRTAPMLEQGSYEQSSVAGLAALLMGAREEYERAAARRVEENGALRALFERAAPSVEDADLGEKLRDAAAGSDPGLRVSELEAENATLRALLIELHAHVETLDTEVARAVEQEIWRELVTSTERRKLALDVF